jgi:hypothetical protein
MISINYVLGVCWEPEGRRPRRSSVIRYYLGNRVIHCVCLWHCFCCRSEKQWSVESITKSACPLSTYSLCDAHFTEGPREAPVEEILPRGGGEGVEAVVSMKQLTHCKGKIIRDDQRKLGLE